MDRDDYQQIIEVMAKDFRDQVNELSLKVRDLETENAELKRSRDFYRKRYAAKFFGIKGGKEDVG